MSARLLSALALFVLLSGCGSVPAGRSFGRYPASVDGIAVHRVAWNRPLPYVDKSAYILWRTVSPASFAVSPKAAVQKALAALRDLRGRIEDIYVQPAGLIGGRAGNPRAAYVVECVGGGNLLNGAPAPAIPPKREFELVIVNGQSGRARLVVDGGSTIGQELGWDGWLYELTAEIPATELGKRLGVVAYILSPATVAAHQVTVQGKVVPKELAFLPTSGPVQGPAYEGVRKERITAAAPPCTAAELRVRGGRGGENTGARADVLFTDVGSSACVLNGLPRAIELLRKDGSVLDTKPAALSPSQLGPVFLKPHAANAADMIIFWANWCEAQPGPLRIRITLPGSGGTVTGPFNGPPDGTFVPECLQEGQPSTLQILEAYGNGM